MIKLSSCAGQTIAVMGLGKSGLATLAALKNAGARILAWDDKPESHAEAEAAGYQMTNLTALDWNKENIRSLILSPGIPHTYPAPHPVAQLAKTHKVEIIGDIELLLREPSQAKFIGITGTNGKSTTTALIAHILKQSGKPVEVGGNLGIAALSFAPLEAGGFYVIEMSSYQCELTPSAAFDIGVWLNITPDHIDRHKNIQGYVAAKKRMFRESSRPQHFIFGVDDDYSATTADELERETKAKLTRVSCTRLLEKGISVLNGRVYENAQIIFETHEAKTLPGVHNGQNIGVATAACLSLGLAPAEIIKHINTYPGLPHRMQRVREMGKVLFINDSKATNADAAGKALACYDSIYWILGGKPKEGGLSGLEEFMPRIRHAFLIGQASDEFAGWLEGKAPYTKCEVLENAVKAAAAMAATSPDPHPVVLLSPACASFDQFKSYEHRGDMFMQFVRSL